MKLSWSPEANEDLANVYDYIAASNPAAAYRVQNAIILAAESLLSWPNRGRPGRWSATRELILRSLPYFIVYQRRADIIFIVRVVHGHQLWPPAEGG